MFQHRRAQVRNWAFSVNSRRVGRDVHQLGAYVVANQAEFPWSVAALPRARAEIQQRSTTFTGPFLIGNNSNVDGAWELVKYLTGPEGQRAIMKGAVVGTSRESLLEEWLGQFNAPIEDLLAVRLVVISTAESPNVRIVGWWIRPMREIRFGLPGRTHGSEERPFAFTEAGCFAGEIYNANVDKARELFPDFPE
jgi:hypothetical protein